MKEASVCLSDSRKRLDTAVTELQALLDDGGELLAEKGPAEVEEAKALLAANPISES